MNAMILHMGRSGGHAIIEWVCQNLPGRVALAHNCIKGWEQKQFIPKKTKEYSNPGDGIHTVSTIEDFHLPLWKKYEMDHWNQQFDKIITVVRSPRNWLASSIAAGGWAEKYLDKAPKDAIELPVSRVEAYLCYFNLEEIVENFEIQLHQIIMYDRFLQGDLWKTIYAEMVGIDPKSPRPKHCKFSSFGKNHDYTGDRYELLNYDQKKRFDQLYKGELKRYQEAHFA
jgi:hypothetical protein